MALVRHVLFGCLSVENFGFMIFYFLGVLVFIGFSCQFQWIFLPIVFRLNSFSLPVVLSIELYG